MSIFSLQDVTALQIQNINDGNFRNWPEDNLRSYSALGGKPPGNSPVQVSTIATFDYSTETEIDTSITYPGTTYHSMISNTTDNYGYFSGGINPTATINITRRLEYSNETISLPGNDMPSNLYGAGSGINSKSYGYVMGGNTGATPPAHVDSIIKLDFATEQWSSSSTTTPIAMQDTGTVQSNEHAYLIGGESSSGFTSARSKFNLSTEEISTLPDPSPNTASHSDGTSSASSGYISGGRTGPDARLNTIEKIDFFNETSNDINYNMSENLDAMHSFGNFHSGYFANGQSPLEVGWLDPENPRHKKIYKIDFISDTGSSIPGEFSGSPDGYSHGASVSGYKSILRPSGFKTLAYICGGIVGNSVTNVVTRFNFSDDTASASTNLPNAIAESHVTSSFDHGYIMGGRNPASPLSRNTTVKKINFSTDVTSDTSNSLPFGRNKGGTASNTENAYLSGGSYNAPFTRSAVSRLNFSTETITDTNMKVYDVDYIGTAGVTDGTYGYFVGGLDPDNAKPPNWDATFSTVSKLDFSSETISNPGNPFTRWVSQSTVTQNNLYGFYMANKAGPVVSNTPPNPEWNPDTYRLDFATSVASSTGENTFAPGMVSNPGAGASGEYYGYVLGGGDPNPEYCNTGYKFDYTTSTKENLPALLSGDNRRDECDGISNSAMSTN